MNATCGLIITRIGICERITRTADQIVSGIGQSPGTEWQIFVRIKWCSAQTESIRFFRCQSNVVRVRNWNTLSEGYQKHQFLRRLLLTRAQSDGYGFWRLLNFHLRPGRLEKRNRPSGGVGKCKFNQHHYHQSGKSPKLTPLEVPV